MDIVFSIILTAVVVSLFWWRLGQSYRVQASHADADLKSMDERLENAQMEMEHHRDAVFDAMTDGILVCSLKERSFSGMMLAAVCFSCLKLCQII